MYLYRAIVGLRQMPEREIVEHIAIKTKDIVILGVTILADNVFLGIWFVIIYGLEEFVAPRFHVASRIEITVFVVIRIIFSISMLCPCVFWTYRDIRIFWMRSNEAIANTESEMQKKNSAASSAPEA